MVQPRDRTRFRATSSITIHDLDERVVALIRARAEAEGTSLNETITRLLEQALGVRAVPHPHRKDFAKFCGTWSKEEADEFDKAVADLEKVNPEDG